MACCRGTGRGGTQVKVAIDLPDDIVQQLRARCADVPRHVLESLALESYRSGMLTESQVGRLLGFTTRLETNSFLRQHEAWVDYEESEIDREIENQENLLQRDNPRR